jgi:hypothetical protein
VNAEAANTVRVRPTLASAPPDPETATKRTSVRIMVEVSVEVRRGDVARRVTVRAESIERALELAKGRHGAEEARVLFPIDPEAFFAGGPPARFVRAGELGATG